MYSVSFIHTSSGWLASLRNTLRFWAALPSLPCLSLAALIFVVVVVIFSFAAVVAVMALAGSVVVAADLSPLADEGGGTGWAKFDVHEFCNYGVCVCVRERLRKGGVRERERGERGRENGKGGRESNGAYCVMPDTIEQLTLIIENGEFSEVAFITGETYSAMNSNPTKLTVVESPRSIAQL